VDCRHEFDEIEAQEGPEPEDDGWPTIASVPIALWVTGRRLRRFWSLEFSLHRWYTKWGQVTAMRNSSRNKKGFILLIWNRPKKRRS
jgi:hypothetical protein